MRTGTRTDNFEPNVDSAAGAERQNWKGSGYHRTVMPGVWLLKMCSCSRFFAFSGEAYTSFEKVVGQLIVVAWRSCKIWL